MVRFRPATDKQSGELNLHDFPVIRLAGFT